MKWFSVGVEAQGVIAIGQFATGVIAIGQSAVGFIAVGQMARGVFVLGQLAVGIVAIGQIALSVTWGAGMLGMATFSPGMIMITSTGLRAPGRSAGTAPGLRGMGPARLLLVVIGVGVLAFAWWYIAGQTVLTEVFAEGGVLQPGRELR